MSLKDGEVYRVIKEEKKISNEKGTKQRNSSLKGHRYLRPRNILISTNYILLVYTSKRSVNKDSKNYGYWPGYKINICPRSYFWSHFFFFNVRVMTCSLKNKINSFYNNLPKYKYLLLKYPILTTSLILTSLINFWMAMIYISF